MFLTRFAFLAAPLLLLTACDEMLFAPAPPPAPAPQGQIAPASPTDPAPVVDLSNPALAIEDPAAGPAAVDNQPLPFVKRYRSEDDPCRLVGESDFTRPHLSDSADLVACPRNGAAWQTLATERAAKPVAQTGLYTLWSVPRG